MCGHSLKVATSSVRVGDQFCYMAESWAVVGEKRCLGGMVVRIMAAQLLVIGGVWLVRTATV